MIQSINAAIDQLRADTQPFLDVQKQRLRDRHAAVEQSARHLQQRRQSCIALQRKLYLDQKNKSAPTVFLKMSDAFEINLLAGIESHTTTLGYLRHDLPTTSRLGIIFSGRHLLGETGRTHAWFFDRPSSEMKNCLKSPLHINFLSQDLCGNEHLTYQTIDVEDHIPIPAKTNEDDFESGIPGLEITIAQGSNIHMDLIDLAETIAARADAILNTISTRWSANLNYLIRREQAVLAETKRVQAIEQHLERAETNWVLELKIANEYRRWSECVILVNMGTEQDRLQQVLTTTDLLLCVPGSELSRMIEEARQIALYEETSRRWGLETITIPISSPQAVWSFRRCILYLHLEWPKGWFVVCYCFVVSVFTTFSLTLLSHCGIVFQCLNVYHIHVLLFF